MDILSLYYYSPPKEVGVFSTGDKKSKSHLSGGIHMSKPKSKGIFYRFPHHCIWRRSPYQIKKLIRKAGIGSIDMDGKFVAIKMHFGELGNISYLRPNYAKAVVDVIKELGGKPF